MVKKKTLVFSLVLLALVILPFSLVYAVGGGLDSGGPGGLQIENPIKADSLAALLSDILSIIVQIGVPILVIMIIFTGFLFVMAKGNKAELEKAKKAIVSVLVGSAIVIGAYAISQAIQNTVGALQTGGSAPQPASQSILGL